MANATHEVSVFRTTVDKRFAAEEAGGAAREWDALTLLEAAAPGLAPAPIARRTGADGAVTITMTRVPGRSLDAGPLSVRETEDVADALRRLHAVPPLPNRRPFTPSDALHVIREDPAPGTVPPAEVREVMTAAITRASDPPCTRAVRHFPSTPVFANGDGNLHNFVRSAAGCCIVDFEDAGRSDLAWEVADLVEHPTSSLSGALSEQVLLSNLDLPLPVVERLAEYRILLAGVWLLLLLPGGPAAHRNPPDSLERQTEHLRDLLG